MPRSLNPTNKYYAPSFKKVWEPLTKIFSNIPPLTSRGNRPLQMDFEHQLKALVFFHLEEHTSASHLIQVLKEDDFARNFVAPAAGIEKSSFSEANNDRGLEQFLYVFKELYRQANKTLPDEYAELGELVAIDGSLIDAVLSMCWADYRNGSKKAKAHLGFDINRSVPRKIFLTDGKGDERPFVSLILEPGQTGIMDRYYQHHKNFDLWQSEGKHFVCRIRTNTKKICLKTNKVEPDSIVFYDAVVLLGTPYVNQTKKEVRLIGYTVDSKEYWVATDRHDLSAEQIAFVYKLRWDIEKFFAWWKRHLRVYHLICRSEHGLMVQILAGLITYLLLALYCHEEHGEKVSIKRVRELRNKIRNESRYVNSNPPDPENYGNGPPLCASP